MIFICESLWTNQAESRSELLKVLSADKSINLAPAVADAISQKILQNKEAFSCLVWPISTGAGTMSTMEPFNTAILMPISLISLAITEASILISSLPFITLLPGQPSSANNFTPTDNFSQVKKAGTSYYLESLRELFLAKPTVSGSRKILLISQASSFKLPEQASRTMRIVRVYTIKVSRQTDSGDKPKQMVLQLRPYLEEMSISSAHVDHCSGGSWLVRRQAEFSQAGTPSTRWKTLWINQLNGNENHYDMWGTTFLSPNRKALYSDGDRVGQTVSFFIMIKASNISSA